MPTQKSNRRLRQAPQAMVSFAVYTFLLLCAPATAKAAMQQTSGDDGSFFSTYGVTIVLVLALTGLIVYKVRSSRSRDVMAAKSSSRAKRSEDKTPPRPPVREFAMTDEQRSPAEAVQQRERPQTVEQLEASAYGAYRIDQEVVKLILGKPHRMDVMSSRTHDDRRAIEASLMKALDAPDTSEETRERIRQALEEYGFVARQSATLLLGRDAWERSAAARTLGQIRSASSLPFLTEALHDPDPVVRNLAIASLGQLKTPSAIGALLDIARRHPDIPASLLSETLSACSVESLGYLDSLSAEPLTLGDDAEASELTAFEDLPTGEEDEALTETLGRLKNSDERTRVQAAQELGFHVYQRSVSALSSLALNDPEAAVRAAAVLSLGAIDHPSVFPPVLIALADDSREVRAAAARTLTGLHFDRSDAYVRVMDSADAETLRQVAQSCIKTGLVPQTVARLASDDRRQAYEAFSLFSLLARAGETKPILDAIQNHHDEEVRLCAVKVLNSAAAAPDLAPKLRELVTVEDLPETVRKAILEVLYKLDQEQPIFDIGASDNAEVSLHNSQ